MRWEGLTGACAIGLLVATVGAAEHDSLPAPWLRTGSATPAEKCRVSAVDVKDQAFDRSLLIRCDGVRSGFATAMQQIAADDYRGKRVRLSGQLRAQAVQGWAGLWMRVDGASGAMLAGDTMRGRPLIGTFDWRPVSVVLDVAPEAQVIAFGVMQEGDGAIFSGAIKIEVVGLDVPTTAAASTLSKAPANLSLR